MKNKLYTWLALGLLSMSACKSSQTAISAADATAEVRQVLEEQAACWSAGDLECYMQGYWKSDSLLFVGSRGLTYGWQQTLDNYKRGYPDVAAMGKLRFDLKEMRQLSPETMLVVGKWHLQRAPKTGDMEGHFSVIFRRFPDGWKIIADHSS
ncbi:YybH family protein [Pontibacter litorisediminis]|uniref:YybH family protein n=1 Tax=Pontibacter litorisediminis TaxID=1846260 RepID=UPI0023EC9CB2|nr:nuclear transport factor 2 family protein [Pontibacter litorisediminis]